MTNDQRLVSAFFPDRQAAESAYRQLPDHGIPHSVVSAIGSKGDITPQDPDDFDLTSEGLPTPVTRAAKAGATVGAVAGVLGGALLTFGFFIFPAAGLAVVGPLVGAITGAGLAKVTGSVRNSLMSAGMTESEAIAAEERIKAGGMVLAVHTEASQADQVVATLRKLGGEPLAVDHVAGVF